MPTPRVAAVIPCYNTSDAAVPVARGAAAFCHPVLAIDDGSTDDTGWHLASAPCEVLTLRPNRGKGAALEAAIRVLLARTGPEPIDYVLVIDGDGQHAPSDIPRLLDAVRDAPADLVIGVRDPAAMPRKNRIGAHFSRLLFLIGTGRFVADTQCGFRLLSVPLLRPALDAVSWQGYETESALLRRVLDAGGRVRSVPITTIYIDGNRRSQFSAWRDSTRIAAVFGPQIAWTVAMAWVDVGIFAALVAAGLPPVAANLIARPAAVGAHLLVRRDGLARLRTLGREQGGPSLAAAFAGHLALTTVLLAGFVALGAPAIAAKIAAQLTGYLTAFAIADRVMFRRAVRQAQPSPGAGQAAGAPAAR